MNGSLTGVGSMKVLQFAEYEKSVLNACFCQVNTEPHPIRKLLVMKHKHTVHGFQNGVSMGDNHNGCFGKCFLEVL